MEKGLGILGENGSSIVRRALERSSHPATAYIVDLLSRYISGGMLVHHKYTNAGRYCEVHLNTIAMQSRCLQGFLNLSNSYEPTPLPSHGRGHEFESRQVRSQNLRFCR